MSTDVCKPTHESEIVIIGAGLSGLTAAYCLRKKNIPFMLVEAGERIGGRIHSLYHGTKVYQGDLGPTWVWPEYQPIAQRWLEKLKVKTFEQFDRGDAMVEQDKQAKAFRYQLPGQHGIRRIVGGPQAIINTLANGLNYKTLLTNCMVESVQHEGEGLLIHCANGDTIKCSKAIVAIAPRIAEQAIKWPDDLDTALLQIMRHTPTWMATHAKLVVTYKTPFWRQADLSGRVASSLGPIMEAHDHSPEDASFGALFGFLGWPYSIRQSRNQTLRQDVIDQLIRCFGSKASKFTNLHIEDWAENSNVCSTLDMHGPMAHPQTPPELIRAQHLGGKLVFAGAEVSEISPGLIEGALNAGEVAAQKIIAS